jgi:hypothetical protein
MTPKEKAEELVDKMYQELPDHYDDHNQAKRCALIAVDEIIKDQNGDDTTIGNKTWWWNQVKNEIEKL